MSICSTNTAVKYEGKRVTHVSLPCNSWFCEHCQPKRLKECKAQAFAGTPDMMITLTIRNNGTQTDAEAARTLSWAWKRCRERLMRKYKRPLPFMCFVERHPSSGFPHFHILCRSKYIPHKVISAIMRDLINSPNVWINRLTTKKKRVNYCTQYSSKCLHKIGTTKRYWKSKDYDMRSEEELERFKKRQPGWHVHNKCLDYYRSLTEWLFVVVIEDTAERLVWEQRGPP